MVFDLHTEGAGKGSDVMPTCTCTKFTSCTNASSADEMLQVIRDVTPMVLSRALKLCNFLDWKDIKVLPIFCTLCNRLQVCLLLL
jgi:hypothetical protein